MERFGIVGLPNAGKSSLFNALTGGNTLVAAHPFSTTETNVGVAKVPDHRLDALAEMSQSKKVVHATAEFVDIAGIQKGSNAGEGLGNKFLGGIREVDATLYVLRAFVDPNVVGGGDPLDDLATLELELVLADAASAETQLERRRKAAKSDKSLAGEVAVLEKAVDLLQAAMPLYHAGLSRDEITALQPYFLITAKPVLVVVNLGEDQLDQADAIVASVAGELSGAAEVLAACVQLEAETAQLDAGERAELLDGLGLGEGALPRVISAAYHLLGPAHVPHDRRQGEPCLDLPRRCEGARVRGRDPQRPAARLHPRRGDQVGRAALARVVEQGEGRGQAPRRRQGLRGAGRRHAGDPLQRVTSSALRSNRHCSTRNRSWMRCSRSGKSRFASPIGTTSGRSTS